MGTISAKNDIVQDMNPRIHKYQVNGSTIAGALVYISESNGVTMVSNASTQFPRGVALQNKADNKKVAVAVPSTTVYLNLSSTYANISANTFLMPDYNAVGGIVAADSTGGLVFNMVGAVEELTSTGVVRVQLNFIPNMTI